MNITEIPMYQVRTNEEVYFLDGLDINKKQTKRMRKKKKYTVVSEINFIDEDNPDYETTVVKLKDGEYIILDDKVDILEGYER